MNHCSAAGTGPPDFCLTVGPGEDLPLGESVLLATISHGKKPVHEARQQYQDLELHHWGGNSYFWMLKIYSKGYYIVKWVTNEELGRHLVAWRGPTHAYGVSRPVAFPAEETTTPSQSPTPAAGNRGRSKVAAGPSRKPRVTASSKAITMQVDEEESSGEEDYEASDSGESAMYETLASRRPKRHPTSKTSSSRGQEVNRRSKPPVDKKRRYKASTEIAAKNATVHKRFRDDDDDNEGDDDEEEDEDEKSVKVRFPNIILAPSEALTIRIANALFYQQQKLARIRRARKIQKLQYTLETEKIEAEKEKIDHAKKLSAAKKAGRK
ncbi:MAG: hypothetical protein Q9221_003541 [Calogaya cf. arnoldii]